MVKQLLFKNYENTEVVAFSDNGQVDITGDLYVGNENEAQVYLGTNHQWRIRKSVLDDTSAFEIWDTNQQARMVIHGSEADDQVLQTSFATAFSVEDWAVLKGTLSIGGAWTRVHGTLSVLDSISMSSSASVRSFLRIGSTLSAYGMIRLGSTLSVLDSVCLGSTMSLRGFARFGSALTVFGRSRMGATASVVDFTNLGSAISLRSFLRVGSSLSVFSRAQCGSSVRELVTYFLSFFAKSCLKTSNFRSKIVSPRKNQLRLLGFCIGLLPFG